MTASPMEQWLKHAPAPKPLVAPMQYDVFLSYRSVRREWVLQLHDILIDLGYKVFLDQMAIPAGGSLAGTLGDAMRKSASAVLIWSKEYTDSAWCREEYETMQRRRIEGKAFYVVAKLDLSQLPEFAENTTYIDFSDRIGGPSGTNLLRLLYGLRGEPLPNAAVHLAAEVDVETREAGAKIRAAREVGNLKRLVELTQSTSLPWISSPVLVCEAADAMIALEHGAEAIEALERVEKAFPKAVRPKQLRGLALARQKRWEDAQTIFSELYHQGEIDPETLGMYARTWRDRYAASKNQQHLRMARDLYLQAFRAVPGDYYTGINAASNSVLLGELDLAKDLASEVEKLVGTTPVPGDYWKTATMAEVQLLKQDYQKAAELYQAAVAGSPEETGSHGSSYGQILRLLEHLKPGEDDRQSVVRVFGHLPPG